MRITSEMLSSNFLYDLNNNLTNMSTDQKQMATGTKISEPSDDPLGTSKVMNINSEIAQNTQYSTNIKDATNSLNTTDSTLSQVTSVLQRVNELLVSTGSAAYGASELTSVKDEINQEVSQTSQLLNTSYDGKYIFAGTSYDTKPTGTTTDTTTTSPTYGNTTLNYVGSDGTTAITASATPIPTPPVTSADIAITNINSDLPIEISAGVTINYNVTAGQVMNFTNSATTGGTSNLMDLFKQITTDLSTASSSTASATAVATSRANLVGADLTNIQDAIKGVSNVTTKIGALENRMSSASTENESQSTALTTALSAVDDIDYADASMNYSQAQTVYQAALQTSAKVLQNTLLDYIS